MSGFAGGIALAGGAILMVLTAVILNMAKTEGSTRLERLPALILRRAVRHLPEQHRADQLEEWEANLRDVIHAQTEGLPVTRLLRGLTFAGSSWRGSWRLAYELDERWPTGPLHAYRRAAYLVGARVELWASRRRWPRAAAELLGWSIAMHSRVAPYAVFVSFYAGTSPPRGQLGEMVLRGLAYFLPALLLSTTGCALMILGQLRAARRFAGREHRPAAWAAFATLGAATMGAAWAVPYFALMPGLGITWWWWPALALSVLLNLSVGAIAWRRARQIERGGFRPTPAPFPSPLPAWLPAPG